MSSTGKPKAVRLAQLSGPAGVVELPSGREVEVRPAPAAAYQLFRDLREAQFSGEPDERFFDELVVLMATLLPDTTEDERAALTPQMMGAVLAISMGHIAAVEAAMERDGSVATAATRAPRSSRRRTKSNTSSSG